MGKSRLIIVQGPSQLLNVLSVLSFQQANGEYRECEDFLVLGGFCGNSTSAQGMIKICIQLSQVWNFKDIFLLLNLERLFRRYHYSFLATIRLLKNSIGLQNVDVVYTCRNWQFINEVFLSAYPGARKICYGDGLGLLDLNNEFWCKSSHNPQGLVEIHEAYLITPIEGHEKAFRNCNINIVNPDFFKSVVYKGAEYVEGLSEYCQKISSQVNGPITFVSTSNLTEAKYVKNLEEEIDCYLSCILPYSQENDVILVKGHPRQTSNQSEVLCNKLNQLGQNAILVSEFNQVPIEGFIPFLEISKAITCASWSSVSLAYLCKCEIVIGFGEQIVKRYFLPQFQEYFLRNEIVKQASVRQALDGEFKPIEYPSSKMEIIFSPLPIHMKPLNNMLNTHSKVGINTCKKPQKWHLKSRNLPANGVYMILSILSIFRRIYLKTVHFGKLLQKTQLIRSLNKDS